MQESEFSFELDGTDLPFEPGQSIMEAATQAGVYIPHLCHHPDLRRNGSCKLCTVKVNGRFGSACALPAQAGCTVESNTSELQEMRRQIVQMLFVEGNHYCPFCEKSGNCQLQVVAYHVGMVDMHFPPFNTARQLDASHREMLLDRDRCIQCARCVRASQDLDKKNIFGLAGRGMNIRLVVNSDSGLLGDTDFSSADHAAQVCPTGALIRKDQAYPCPIGSRLYDTPISQHTIRQDARHD
ncbi:MAG: (2Fe-2S)-binding protein [Paludibacterium sp.]|uniref:2Fe-2S iron-sulfur cluster-binding protein n=1 Tax=Paludibacterium sp. TaxID=1917523 RepID=UPI0025F8B66A|nr:2Fe-2S iron-sulfur cluster-binding protein [Paludibacterium sp.]MBV8046491.1 (2Fe-2S)-binding protein [Paludibacterium sp.]MBV8646555.1 (2Fe-2S)-binding protein [Paludibacterium sp.]